MGRQGIWIDQHTFTEFSGDAGNSLSKEIATRDRSIDFYNLGMYLPNPDPILRKSGQNIKVYNELLSDAHVGSCVINRKSGVQSMQWSVDRGKAKSRQAKITSDALQALDMNRIIGEILNAPLCGYQPLEVLWGKVGGWILPIDVVGKPRNWFAFDASNNPRFLTKVDMILGEELPPKQFLFARYEPTYDNPYGFPLLSRCFWPVTFKKGGYKFWVTFLEKFGMPFLWGKLPRGLGKKEYDDLYDILERMVTDAVAVTPDDGSISMIESKGSSGSSDIYEKFLTFADSEVSKAIVGQTLTTQVGEKGSYATSQTHMEVRNDIVLGDKRLCESTMNQLIIWIDELNFQSGNPPTFSLYKEEDVDLTLAERDDKLTTAMEKSGLSLTRTYYKKNYSLDDEDIEDAGTAQTTSQFSASDTTTADAISPLDSMANRMNKEASAAMTGMWAPIEAMINEAQSLEELRDKLVEAYKDMDVNALGTLMEQAFAVAELAGRFTVKQ